MKKKLHELTPSFTIYPTWEEGKFILRWNHSGKKTEPHTWDVLSQMIREDIEENQRIVFENREFFETTGKGFIPGKFS